MTFIATPNLWDPETNELVASGKLKLQPGQRVFCGNREHPSIFAGVSNGGTIYAAHWQGSRAATWSRFQDLMTALNGRAK
jgi:hypothetical protein